jgi:hypothetical protein
MRLDQGTRDLYGDEWENATVALISMLRLDAAEPPGSSRRAAIVSELSERSALFREHWRDQTVSSWQHHHKVLRHPAFGEMAFTNEFLTVQSARAADRHGDAGRAGAVRASTGQIGAMSRSATAG